MEVESTFRQSIHAEKQYSTEAAKKATYDRRGSFYFLPVHSSNDLVVGSWYFVFGSLFFVFIGSIPLINVNAAFWQSDTYGDITQLEVIVLSSFFIVSGVFFTLGSLAFVRALKDEEIKKSPLFPNWYHLSTDEQLGAWLYFLAMCPYPPYVAVYIYNSPTEPILWAGLIAAILCLVAMYLFVRACYPGSSRKYEMCGCIPRLLRACCGAEACLAKHLDNDWLLGCWIFFIGSFLFTVAFFLEMGQAVLKNNPGTVFISALDAIDFLFFTVGCAYFCAGSYPQLATTESLNTSNGRSGVDIQLTVNGNPLQPY